MVRCPIDILYRFFDQCRFVHVNSVSAMKILSFISIVQALDRALLVDTLPTSEQRSGNAWAARMLAIGSVLGFFV